MSKKLNPVASVLPLLLWLILHALLPEQLLAREFQYTYEGQTVSYTVLDEEARTVSTSGGDPASIIPNSNVSGELRLPQTVVDADGVTYTLTEIADNSFTVCAITSVELPVGLVSIGESAFYHCTGLTSITIPDSVTEINGRAFAGCTAMRSVIIGGSVTVIGNGAFSGCVGLTDINIPGSVTQIRGNAFSGCTGLTNVTIGDSVTVIHDGAFSGCVGLTSITIPDSVTTIYGGAFSGCTGLTDVTVGDSVTAIESGTFSGCTALTDVTLGKSVDHIYDESFIGCDNLATLTLGSIVPPFFVEDSFPDKSIMVTVPSGSLVNYIVTDWDRFHNLKDASGVVPEVFTDDVFRYRVISESEVALVTGDYSSLSSVCIPERVEHDGVLKNVTFISDGAFAFCVNITVLALPKGLKSIGTGAFSGCVGLTELSLPASVTTIGKSAFSLCHNLARLDMPESLESIGDRAFSRCEGLVSLDFPENVVRIGYMAFNQCAGLTQITFNSSDVTIDRLAFSLCTGLNSVVARKHIKSVGDRAFEGCGQLMSFRHGGIGTVGEYAFYDCTDLRGMIVDWAEIEKGTFSNCRGMRNLVLTERVTDIRWDAFDNCESLEEVAFEDGAGSLMIWDELLFSDSPVKSMYIGRDCIGQFGCDEISSVTFGNLVTSIPWGAFTGASSLSNVTFGISVEEIGNEAFMDCALAKVVLPPHVSIIGSRAFAGNGLNEIAVGPDVTLIGYEAFDGSDSLTAVSITALTPPMAGDDAFSSYGCALYVMPSENDAVKMAYHDSTPCWNRFAGYDLVVASGVEIEGEGNLVLEPGETVRLSARVMPADVSLPYVFWRSTNPSFAKVDNEGNVTRVQKSGADSADDGVDEVHDCRIIAETLYGGVTAAVTVTDLTTGIDEGFTDAGNAGFDRVNDIYTMQGVCIRRDASQDDIDSLAPGLYIIGGKKILVR